MTDGTEPGVPRLLFPGTATHAGIADDRSYASDLNLDQVVDSMVAQREEPEYLTGLFFDRLGDVDSVRYRQEVFRDLEDWDLKGALDHFTHEMQEVRSHLRQVEKMIDPYQRQGWQLDAASIYCSAVQSVADALASVRLASRGLAALRSYVGGYVASPAFTTLAAESAAQRQALDEISYCIRIRGGKVDVARYRGEADYSAEVLKTFARFQQGAAADYRVAYRTRPGINHVTSQILQLVARLFPREFSLLDEYCRRHAVFLDDGLRQFEREIQFYLSYIDYVRPLRAAGLPFCYPEVPSASKEVFAHNTFDLALAAKLVWKGAEVVANDFELTGGERVFVVTGPNQGGKTTFARTFGQLHHLASLGCPVPGTAARLTLFDRLLTLFEREEDLARMSGKLEDDIVRVGELLHAATPRSIILLNEVFTSTTLHDARFLGTKLVTKILELGALGVYVTFVDELASLGDSIVSVMSTVVPEDPTRRTFKVMRRSADGLAYALAIAETHNVTYERLRGRIVR